MNTQHTYECFRMTPKVTAHQKRTKSPARQGTKYSVAMEGASDHLDGDMTAGTRCSRALACSTCPDVELWALLGLASLIGKQHHLMLEESVQLASRETVRLPPQRFVALIGLRTGAHPSDAELCGGRRSGGEGGPCAVAMTHGRLLAPRRQRLGQKDRHVVCGLVRGRASRTTVRQCVWCAFAWGRLEPHGGRHTATAHAFDPRATVQSA